MKGTSVSHGPHAASRLTEAPSSPTSNHRWLRTNRIPSVRSCQAEPWSSTSRPRPFVRMNRIMSAEKAKVPASTPNAHPAPTAATRSPPITGPAIDIAIGRTNCPSELACTRRLPGTIIGRRALNEG